MALIYELWDASDLADEHWQSFKALWQRNAPMQTGFMDPDFARLIQDVRGDVSVLIAKDDVDIVAFWPLHIGAGRSARGVGSPFSDLNGPIVDDGAVLDLNQALRDVSIAGFSTQGLVQNSRTKFSAIDTEELYLTDLSDGYAAFLEGQTKAHKSFYKSLRRKGRKVTNDFKDVEFTFDNTSVEVFNQLIALKRRQFEATRRHDVLKPEWVMKMLNVLQSKTLPDTRSILSTLHFDGKLAAAELNLCCGDTLQGWLVAYDPSLHQYSPGNLIIQRILEAMPDHGLQTYDSGAGAGYYKKFHSNRVETVHVGTIEGHDNWLSPINLLGNGWSFLEKQSPETVSEQMGRIRRRYGQIISTETRLDRKALGMAKALMAIGANN